MQSEPKRLAALSPKERQVLELTGIIGHSKGVAAELGISTRTVEHHLANARRKLGCETTVQAIAKIGEVRETPPTASKTSLHRPGGGLWWTLFGAVVALILFGSIFLISNPSVQAKTSPGRAEASVLPIVIKPNTFRDANNALLSPPNVQYFQGDDFGGVSLEPGWCLTDGLGDVSLLPWEDSIRYSLTGSTHPGDTNSKWLYRYFEGTRWAYSLKAIYSIPKGTGRQFKVSVVFGKDVSNNTLSASLDVCGEWDDSTSLIFAYMDSRTISRTPIPMDLRQGTLYFSIERYGQQLRFRYGQDPDGIRWTSDMTYSTPLPGIQAIKINCNAFGSPKDKNWGGGYMQLDYLRLSTAPYIP